MRSSASEELTWVNKTHDASGSPQIGSHAVGVELHAALMADLFSSHTFINHTDDCSIDQCFYQPGNCELSKLLKLHKQKIR